MLVMAMLVIAATIVAPRVVQEIKRDRGEEMIQCGAEYARVFKKFFKRNGGYPASLDELDKGEIRYLRLRYSDPLTKEGNWKVLRYGNIQSLMSSVSGPGVERGTLALQRSADSGTAENQQPGLEQLHSHLGCLLPALKRPGTRVQQNHSGAGTGCPMSHHIVHQA